MNRALIVQEQGKVEEIDLLDATPEEQAVAIRNHMELELVLILARSVRTIEEAARELE